MDYEESKIKLVKDLGFSDEKLDKLIIYVNELLNFNKKYNLISKNSEKLIWSRHILDSAQLVKFIDPKENHSLADFGTGAGLPGIVLSIYYSDILSFHVKLFEKSNVKSEFLRGIIKKLDLRASLYDNDYQSHIIDSEYIVCRAFKKIGQIIKISREKAKKSHKLIVMMGKSAQGEINKASKGIIYKYKLVPSITERDSKILLVDVIK